MYSRIDLGRERLFSLPVHPSLAAKGTSHISSSHSKYFDAFIDADSLFIGEATVNLLGKPWLRLFAVAYRLRCLASPLLRMTLADSRFVISCSGASFA